MPFVLDCSVTMAWVFPDEASDITARLRDSLLEDRALVPSLWPVEVGSVLLSATRMRLPLATLDKSLAVAARTAGIETPALPYSR